MMIIVEGVITSKKKLKTSGQRGRFGTFFFFFKATIVLTILGRQMHMQISLAATSQLCERNN